MCIKRQYTFCSIVCSALRSIVCSTVCIIRRRTFVVVCVVLRVVLCVLKESVLCVILCVVLSAVLRVLLQAVDDGAPLAAVVLLLPFVHLVHELEEGALGDGRVAVHRPAQELELLHHAVPVLRLETQGEPGGQSKLAPNYQWTIKRFPRRTET